MAEQQVGIVPRPEARPLSMVNAEQRAEKPILQALRLMLRTRNVQPVTLRTRHFRLRADQLLGFAMV